MMRTQIQLPDRLYERLKARAVAEETSLAEIMRKAGEYYLVVHPESAAEITLWRLPAAQDLGAFLVPEERWREMAGDEEAST
jgi:hypothetical protein